jgi:hypothetical protein
MVKYDSMRNTNFNSGGALDMKKMLLGIFLLILSVWCYLFGVKEDVVLFYFIGMCLPVVAIVVFLVGFFEKNNRS